MSATMTVTLTTRATRRTAPSCHVDYLAAPDATHLTDQLFEHILEHDHPDDGADRIGDAGHMRTLSLHHAQRIVQIAAALNRGQGANPFFGDRLIAIVRPGVEYVFNMHVAAESVIAHREPGETCLGADVFQFGHRGLRRYGH